MRQNEALVVFFRLPVLGKVKTRIASTSSHEQALKIYKELITYTIDSVSQTNLPAYFFFDGGLPPLTERNPRFTYQLQCEGNLEKKIEHALSLALKTYAKAVIIGSDCPELSSATITKSLLLLDTYDIAIGPAKDGGFYLLGCKEMDIEMFRDIEWSTSSVTQQLLSNIQQAGLSYKLMEVLSDIDTEEEWLAFTSRNEK